MQDQNQLLIIGGMVLGGIASIATLVTLIILIVRAFQTSVGWGLAFLLIPFFGPLIFVIGKWDRAAKPFLGFVLSIFAGAGAAVMLLMDRGVESFHDSMKTENPFKVEESAPATPPAP